MKRARLEALDRRVLAGDHGPLIVLVNPACSFAVPAVAAYLALPLPAVLAPEGSPGRRVVAALGATPDPSRPCSRSGAPHRSSRRLTPAAAGARFSSRRSTRRSTRSATFAVESALECGQPLIVANVLQIPLGPLCVAMGYGTLEPSEEDAANLRAPPSSLTRSGVTIERLRVLSPHPIDALLELVTERKPGLLIFAPDRAAVKPRSYRRRRRRSRTKRLASSGSLAS
jgi:hypothetical protein